MKLINNTDLSSYTEVFSDRHLNPYKREPGVKNIAYVENNGNITGKGTGSGEPAIYLYSKNDFYFKNNGKIMTNIKGHIWADRMVLENIGSLDKLDVTGRKTFILNKGKLSDLTFGGKDLVFSNMGEFNNTSGGIQYQNENI